MQKSRGYITHTMQGSRSVPQSVQQKIIRQYCEQNGLQFLLSATEFEGHAIMLEGIKEDCICMYSIWCMPRDKEARKRLYASEKEIRFAAENIHKLDSEFLEIVFAIEDYHGSNEFRDTIAYLKQA